jgi:hypothetical protein
MPLGILGQTGVGDRLFPLAYELSRGPVHVSPLR